MAAYVPGFDYDIFISYAHINNESPKTKEKGWGWVDSFHYNLEYYLALKSGRWGKIKIWYDKELDGTQLFDDVISQKIRSSALFFALASKPYYKSKYCCSELKEFYNTAGGNPELLKVENRYRIVHLLLQNIPESEWLPEFGRTPAFCFHDADRNAADWAGYPYRHDNRACEIKIMRLTDAIYDTLETFKKIREDTTSSPEDAVVVDQLNSVVDESNVGEFELYFADVDENLEVLRRRVVDRIKEGDQKVKVGGFLPPPFNAIEHNDKVLERLKSARLSVHLLNEYPGNYMKGMEAEGILTYPQKQAELARRNAHSQLVWMPKNLDIKRIDNKHADYKKLLQYFDGLPAEKERGVSTDAAQTAVDVLRCVPNDLAENILQEIDKLSPRPETPLPNVDGILVDYYSADTRYATQIGSFLSKSGMRVHLVPQSGGDEHAKFLYEETLKQVRNVLIVFGSVADSWAIGRFWTVMKAIVNGECFVNNIFIFLGPPVKTVSAENFLQRKPVKPPTFIHHMDSEKLTPEKLNILL